MAGNTFGHLFRLTTYGESHGVAIGGIIDGFPSGLKLDFEKIEREMQRRKPGQSAIVTQRKEEDKVEFLSGIFNGVTTGTPISFTIANTNAKSKDYSHLKNTYRPSHADYTYDAKYGIRDYRGGGRASARETAARVVAGAMAKQLLSGISIKAYVSSVGDIQLNKNYNELDFSLTESNPVRCPDMEIAREMEDYIRTVRKSGDTVGGVVSCVIQGVPSGWGAPVFDKLHAKLGMAMLSINAVKGFEYGSGFSGTKMLGSQHNDTFRSDFTTETNYSGGIQGGISNGEDIYFNIAFKPVATLMQKQELLHKDGVVVTEQGRGRHDPCVVPRAVPIVEAMAAIVLADFYLQARTDRV
ncbi:MAG TPA: chorismate synthase [Flavobacteriaceae bacterium]|nr:chorismate synthase [Flavobacteriaceae bacterium]